MYKYIVSGRDTASRFPFVALARDTGVVLEKGCANPELSCTIRARPCFILFLVDR